MNFIKNINKIKSGETLIINPETNFLNSPYCDQASNNGMNALYSIDKNTNKINLIGFNFVRADGSENTVYTQGGALNMVQTSPQVKELIKQGMPDLFADGKLTPSEVVLKSYTIGNVGGSNFRRILGEQILKNMGIDDNYNRGFYGAEGVLGSFDVSMRVKADGYTISICVYDSKTLRSISDGNTTTNLRNFPNTKIHFVATYQRYIWDMVLCAPGLNQKKRK